MPVDPQISLAAGTGAAAPQNPLNTVGQYAQTANALNNLKLFPGQLQQQQLATNQMQLAQTQHRMQAVNAMLAPLAGSPNLTHAQVMGALGGLKAAGIPTGEFEADAAQTMPTGDGPELAQWFKTNVAARIMSPDAIASAVVGTPGTMSNGQSLQPGVVGGALLVRLDRTAKPRPCHLAPQRHQPYPASTSAVAATTCLRRSGTRMGRLCRRLLVPYCRGRFRRAWGPLRPRQSRHPVRQQHLASKALPMPARGPSRRVRFCRTCWLIRASSRPGRVPQRHLT